MNWLIIFLLATSLGGPISEYCKDFANGEIQIEDGADYYEKMRLNIIEPLRLGTRSMVAYSKAFELNFVELGKNLSAKGHCDMIRALEDENIKIDVTETKCSGHSRSGKKMTLAFCSIRAWDDYHETLITACSRSSFARVSADDSRSRWQPIFIDFSIGDFVQFESHEGATAIEIVGSKGKNLSVFMNNTGDSSSVQKRVLMFREITGEGETQIFRYHRCENTPQL